MNRKITSEEDFFANNPAAKKARDKTQVKQVITKEQDQVAPPKKVLIPIKKFLKQIEKKKIHFNFSFKKKFTKKNQNLLLKKKTPAIKSKIFSLFFFIKRKNFTKTRKFFFQKKFFLGIVLLLFFGWFSFLGQLFFRDSLKVAELEKTLEYLSSQKKEVTDLQKTVYYQYLSVEDNIKQVFKKLNITADEFTQIKNSLLEKTIKISIKKLDYAQFIKLIYELENASPTLILNFVRLYNLNNNSVSLFLEISGLI